MSITHVYGLTEVYGPVTVCEWHDEWNDLPTAEAGQAQGAPGCPATPVLEGLMVADPETLEPVPSDGETMGRDLHARQRGDEGIPPEPVGHRGGRSAAAWFHTGDLAVMHSVRLHRGSGTARRTLSFSGGENISTIEVEDRAVSVTPAVLEAAVVARARREVWARPPVRSSPSNPTPRRARTTSSATAARGLAGFKVPRTVVFGPLPKTSTGKRAEVRPA